MKKLIFVLLMCSSTVAFGEDLCQDQKKDYEFFRDAFWKEHNEVCTNGCIYTEVMNKNSDNMERIAGTYYLQDCDLKYGRLKK